MADQSQTTAGEIRYDHNGPLRVMAVADGYVMCRRPRCMPFALSVKDWHKLPLTNELVGKSAAPRADRYGVLA